MKKLLVVATALLIVAAFTVDAASARHHHRIHQRTDRLEATPSSRETMAIRLADRTALLIRTTPAIRTRAVSCSARQYFAVLAVSAGCAPMRDPAGIGQEAAMTANLNRRKNTLAFDDRLHQAAGQARDAAQKLPQGRERDDLSKKAMQAEAAVDLNRWLSSP